MPPAPRATIVLGWDTFLKLRETLQQAIDVIDHVANEYPGLARASTSNESLKTNIGTTCTSVTPSSMRSESLKPTCSSADPWEATQVLPPVSLSDAPWTSKDIVEEEPWNKEKCEEQSKKGEEDEKEEEGKINDQIQALGLREDPDLSGKKRGFSVLLKDGNKDESIWHVHLACQGHNAECQRRGLYVWAPEGYNNSYPALETIVQPWKICGKTVYCRDCRKTIEAC